MTLDLVSVFLWASYCICSFNIILPLHTKHLLSLIRCFLAIIWYLLSNNITWAFQYKICCRYSCMTGERMVVILHLHFEECYVYCIKNMIPITNRYSIKEIASYSYMHHIYMYQFLWLSVNVLWKHFVTLRIQHWNFQGGVWMDSH